MKKPNRAPILVGSLPGPEMLQVLAEKGKWRLVNLCGADLADIYGHQALAPFQSQMFLFPDVFSEGAPLRPNQKPELVDTQYYLDVSSVAERQQFLAATQATCEALQQGEPVFVFCDRGIARSPLVTLAALLRGDNQTLAEALGRVIRLRPKALFTDISLSALCWSQRIASGM